MNKASKTLTSDSAHHSDKNNYSGEIFYNPNTRQYNKLKNCEFLHEAELSNTSCI